MNPLDLITQMNNEAGRVRCELCSTPDWEVCHKPENCPTQKAIDEINAMSTEEIDAFLKKHNISIEPLSALTSKKLREARERLIQQVESQASVKGGES